MARSLNEQCCMSSNPRILMRQGHRYRVIFGIDFSSGLGHERKGICRQAALLTDFFSIGETHGERDSLRRGVEREKWVNKAGDLLAGRLMMSGERQWDRE
jgi:hypothetical protein